MTTQASREAEPAGDPRRRTRETAESDDHAPRPVQPGFTDAAPGQVPEMKTDSAPELDEAPGGRFARQIAEAPETPDETRDPKD